jgi:hypothetical protein
VDYNLKWKFFEFFDAIMRCGACAANRMGLAFESGLIVFFLKKMVFIQLLEGRPDHF